MAQDLANLDAFKAGPAQAFREQPRNDEDHLSDGIGSSYGVINYKGKNWSLRYRGERKSFLRPDDGTPQSYLDVVILRSAKVKSKSFFEKYDPNGTSEGARPLCASLNGVVPDPDVIAKQADACALCPRNTWKTDPQTGRKGRECQDYKRLAVLLMPNQTRLMFGQPLVEPVFLRIPPASLNNLSAMGDLMDAQGYDYWTYVTRITFDPLKAHPEMLFRALQPLSDKEAPVILPLRSDPICLRITGEDEERLAITHQPKTVAPLLTAAVTEPLVPTSAPALVTVTTPPPATPAPAPATVAPVMSGIFDDTIPAAPAAIPEPALVTAADVGEPDLADEALDARIAKLLPIVP